MSPVSSASGPSTYTASSPLAAVRVPGGGDAPVQPPKDELKGNRVPRSFRERLDDELVLAGVVVLLALVLEEEVATLVARYGSRTLRSAQPCSNVQPTSPGLLCASRLRAFIVPSLD